ALINLNGGDQQVVNSSATATNGGYAVVENDGNAPAGITVQHNQAIAINPDSTATILDSESSSLKITNGETFTISNAPAPGQHLVNPPPVAQQLTPLIQAHLLPSMPLP